MSGCRAELLRGLVPAVFFALLAGCSGSSGAAVEAVPEEALARAQWEGADAVRAFLREHHAAARADRPARIGDSLGALRAACLKLRGGGGARVATPAWEPRIQALEAALAGEEAYAKSGDDALERAVAVQRVVDAVSRLESELRPR